MKPVDVKDNTFIGSMKLHSTELHSNKEVNDKDPKFKVGDPVRISKYKHIFAKLCTPNQSEKVSVIKKVKNTGPWTYVINDLNGDKIIGTFYEKELQKTNQQEFRLEKVIKKKGDKLYDKWKGYDSQFNSWIETKDLIGQVWSYRLQLHCTKMSQYFPKPYEPFGGNIIVKVDLSNYATKTDIKNISHVDTSNFALKSNLASLKTEVDKLDIDKLMPVPVELSKLYVVKIDVVNKTAYDKLIGNLKNIDTNDFVLKTNYN